MSQAVSLSSQTIPDVAPDALNIAPDALNITETLSNLTYLTRLDSESPGMVRVYCDEAEERLKALTLLLSSTKAP